MKNEVFASQTCSVARALELIGEWWTLLIVREAFFGTRRFNEFEKNLAIAKNVLSERLYKLVEAGIMERTPVAGRGNPQDYTLTAKGRDLLPIVIALQQWGDRWIYGHDKAPVRVLDQEKGEEIARLEVLSAKGKPLSSGHIVIIPGPGANDAIRRKFDRG